ncbi:hypothetical protein [Pseudoponticoccus marisrubri]|nr:hypothetical protein [Pseudoponticoccus marisrubri]
MNLGGMIRRAVRGFSRSRHHGHPRRTHGSPERQVARGLMRMIRK